jgi:hypothetical protein
MASRKKKPQTQPNEDWTVDWMIYIALLAAGLFGVAILGALAGPEGWRSILIGYIFAMICLVNFCTYKAHRGHPLERWQVALSRIPLTFAGYGPIRGKPLTEAQGDDRAGLALWMSIAFSVVFLVLISWWLLQPVQSATR